MTTNKTPQEKLEDVMINFNAHLDETDEFLQRYIYLERLRERFRKAISELVNVQ